MIIRPIVPVPAVIAAAALLLVLSAAVLIRARETRTYKIGAGIRLACIILLSAALLLRPMREENTINTEVLNTDVLFVVDRTISMWARDYKGSSPRMDGAKKDCEEILRGLPGASFGVIWFDNTARVMAPFTQDTASVQDVLDMISMPDADYARGSSLNTAYKETEHMLELSDAKEGRQTVLIFISDGEITDGSTLRSFADLKKYVDGGAVLGYGTAEGGNMTDGNGFTVWASDYSKAVSRIDETNLLKISSDLGIEYLHRDGSSSLDALIGGIVEKSRVTSGEKEAVVYEDLYWMLAIPLAVLLLVEMILHLVRR